MGDSEKPFACTSPGCNMSFTNEDHLVVHKKKHDMVLNLGSNGKNTFVADQTPTPTRFIRNCEEVGLFQDLQNVNPFEETFRRAVEGGKTCSLSEPEVSGIDDTLHTPHIFPNIAEVSSSSADLSDKQPEKNIIDTEKNEVITIDEIKTEASETPEIVGSLQSTSNLQINGQEVQLLLKTADGKVMQLSAIPLPEKRSSRQKSSKPQNRSLRDDETSSKSFNRDVNDSKKESIVNSSAMAIAKMRLKETLMKNGTVITSTGTNSVTESVEKSRNNRISEKPPSNTEQGRKQDVQARNRASSMRARAKRKAWIQQLQRTANNANEKNAALQLEVKALRSEVEKLRALLLAHDSCPVTKAIQKGSLETAAAKTQPVSQNIPKHATKVPKKRKLNVESQEAEKIPKLSSSHHIKPRIILPKAEIKPVPVVKNLDGVKIVQVRSLANCEGEQGKRIVLMPNATRRLEFVRSLSRAVIHVNTPVQIENVASKCTGT